MKKITPVQIEGNYKSIMTLFCKQCKNRRLPKWMAEEKVTLWLCESCGNYADDKDIIIREA